jgi:hypothetical protein
MSLCSLNISKYAVSLHGIWIYYPNDEKLPFAIVKIFV